MTAKHDPPFLSEPKEVATQNVKWKYRVEIKQYDLRLGFAYGPTPESAMNRAREYAAAHALLDECRGLLDRLEREGSGNAHTWAAIERARAVIQQAEP